MGLKMIKRIKKAIDEMIYALDLDDTEMFLFKIICTITAAVITLMVIILCS